jgi:hypothetical protein
MTNWQRFKKSLGPMDEETKKAWKPMAYAMQYVGGLKIIGAIILLTYLHH